MTSEWLNLETFVPISKRLTTSNIAKNIMFKPSKGVKNYLIETGKKLLHFLERYLNFDLKRKDMFS